MAGLSSTDHQIELRDGRVLGYAEYGAPDGKPVLYFHGLPGSRISWPPFDPHGAAARLGARVVAIDRPGMGRSDFKPGREILDWPDDVLELADQLKLDRFAVLGISGGGLYAAACAFKIPERLTSAGIVCGMGNRMKMLLFRLGIMSRMLFPTAIQHSLKMRATFPSSTTTLKRYWASWPSDHIQAPENT